MANVNLNEKQARAVNASGHNILVSAGAGSGKTRVLSTRVIKLLKEGKDLDNLLVVTFTNLAANEMRDRIRKDLIEECVNCPMLLPQLDKIESAKIMTFDSFSSLIAKQYSYILNIDRSFSIADENSLEIIREDMIQEILDECFGLCDERFLNFFTMFPGRDTKQITNVILNTYFEFDKKIDPYEYINDVRMKTFNGFYVEKALKDYKTLATELVTEFKNLFNQYYDCCIELQGMLPSEYQDYSNINQYEKMYSLYGPIFSQDIEDINKIEEIIKVSKSNRMTLTKRAPTNEETKEIVLPILEQSNYLDVKNRISKCLDNIKDKYVNILPGGLYEDEKEFRKNLYIFILDTVEKLFRRLDSWKNQNNAYSFIDVSRMAIKALQNKAVQKEVKESFNEILIDEYQDTSDIQDTLVSLIANDNTFIVGDVKQSIYRFRNANPKIFMDKFDNYSETYNGVGEKILMNTNYRSGPEVISNVNSIFDVVMTQKHGDANYKKEHHLECGRNDIPCDANNNLKVINYSVDPKDLNLHTSEFEAFYIAKDIKQKMALSPNLKFSDFAILTYASTDFMKFKKVLESKQIKVSLVSDLKLNESDITKTIIALIKLVSIPRESFDDRLLEDKFKEYLRSYVAVARSFLFEKSENEILEEIQKYQFKSNDYISINKIPFHLVKNDICEVTNRLSEMLDYISNDELYSLMLSEFKVTEKLFLIGNASESLIILDSIRNIIHDNNSIGTSMYHVADVIEQSFKESSIGSNGGLKYSVDETSSGGVRIMTIHKSKGLEFPYVYMPRTTNPIKDGQKPVFGFDHEYGFYIDRDGSLEKILGSIKDKQDGISERIRLFYVAMTRAQKQVIFFHPLEKDYSDLDSINKMMGYALDSDPYCQKIFRQEIKVNDIEQARLDFEIEPLVENKFKYNLGYNSKPDYRKPGFDKNGKEYDCGELIEVSTISHHVDKILQERESENLSVGILFHEYMEHIDFKNINLSHIPEQHKSIIQTVLELPLFMNIDKAQTYKEQEFVFENNGRRYNGIIDLLAIYEDHIDIIDYKFKNIDKPYYVNQLKVYKTYIETLNLNKPINCYLVSLADAIMKRV